MNGNITHIWRNGLKQTGGYGVIDDLSVSYSGNQLAAAKDAAAPMLREGSLDFNGNVTKYVYSASCQKLRTIHYTADSHVARIAYGQTHELTSAEIMYADSTDYMLDGSLILENGRISRYLFGEGHCDFIPSST